MPLPPPSRQWRRRGSRRLSSKCPGKFPRTIEPPLPLVGGSMVVLSQCCAPRALAHLIVTPRLALIPSPQSSAVTGMTRIPRPKRFPHTRLPSGCAARLAPSARPTQRAGCSSTEVTMASLPPPPPPMSHPSAPWTTFSRTLQNLRLTGAARRPFSVGWHGGMWRCGVDPPTSSR
jgi:hypothetical protein